MKTSKVLLNISAFCCFIYFAIYIFSLVFIPIGIYCFLAGKTFSYKADQPDDKMRVSDKTFRNYVIFASIFCFPFGLLAIYPYIYLTSNNIKVSDVKTSNNDETNQFSVYTSEVDETSKSKQTQNVTETDEEKLAKYRKLESFRDKGFITDAELEMAREQLFGKKDD